jgi:hypothetical protein
MSGIYFTCYAVVHCYINIVCPDDLSQADRCGSPDFEDPPHERGTRMSWQQNQWQWRLQGSRNGRSLFLRQRRPVCADMSPLRKTPLENLTLYEELKRHSRGKRKQGVIHYNRHTGVGNGFAQGVYKSAPMNCVSRGCSP